jgi:hypothetical protein
MPVRKYRSVSDMPRPERSDDATLAHRIRILWRRAFSLCPTTPRRGVRRFRSIEDANDERDRATTERMRDRTSTERAR